MTEQDLKFIEILETESKRLDSDRALITKKKKHLNQLINTYKTKIP